MAAPKLCTHNTPRRGQLDRRHSLLEDNSPPATISQNSRQDQVVYHHIVRANCQNMRCSHQRQMLLRPNQSQALAHGIPVQPSEPYLDRVEAQATHGLLKMRKTHRTHHQRPKQAYLQAHDSRKPSQSPHNKPLDIPKSSK